METKSTQPESNEKTISEPLESRENQKQKPKTFKFVEGQGLVEIDPDASQPLNHDEIRRALRAMRTQRKKRQKQGPKKRPKPHAKKWNHDARRHLERYVASVERRAKALAELKAKQEQVEEIGEAA